MSGEDREKVEGQDKPGEKPQAREYASVEDIQNAVKNGELDANAVLADLAALEETEDHPGENQPGDDTTHDEPADAGKQKEAVGEEDKPVMMTVRPSWLKAGSSQYKDVEAMSKGVAEKDRYIEQLKTARADLETRLGKTTTEYQQSLAQLNELKKGGKGGKIVVPDLGKLPELPELTDDDLFDENKRKAYLTAAKERDSMLHKAIESMQKQVETVKPDPEPAPATSGAQQNQPAAPQAHAYDPSVEFNEIEQFRKSPGLEKLFGGDRDIRDIESDYISFMEKLGGIANVSVYDDAGRFTQSIRDAFQLYQNPTTETGKKFRDLCEAKSFRLPEEMPVLERVYAVRRVRNSMRTPDGNPIPYIDAYHLAKSKTPDVFNETDPRDVLVKQHEAEERAVQSRQRFAKETPASAASGSDYGEMSIAQFDRLVKKPVSQYTPKEMEMYVGVLKSKGMTDEEIRELIPSQGSA